ncbi:cellulose biosynthesis cyclic di-GMP-binding regulatory protein BcsB [Pediococcus claussenii]|nr:cellulose biosynthesis cyclic di-GMP-binding regulatory protein BcsB [Pediococcus claussenii]
MNKSFINKQNGIKQNAINKLIIGIITFLGILLFLNIPMAKADSTYTQPLQNQTTTLSGNAVQSNMYFIKTDYWDVKKVSLNLDFQISQLSNDKQSNITISINGQKFYSFKPKNESGMQTKKIDIPTKLVESTNNLQITGQIVTSDGNKQSATPTPADWLTIYNGANVNFEYSLENSNNSIKSFYDHFTGPDTIVNHDTVIATPKTPTNSELSASTYVLSGQSRIITNENEEIPVTQLDSDDYNHATYRLIVAKYQDLPSDIKKEVSEKQVDNQAVIQRIGHKHYDELIVTAKTDELLKKAAQFAANQELMQETDSDTKEITTETDTDTSVLQYQGHKQLSQTDTKLVGEHHQEQAYFINLPVGRTNADGSTINLHFKYAKNLNFKKSLVTVYVNDQPIGSQKLSAANADNDSMTVSLPKGQSLSNNFTIRVAFDLEMDGADVNNSQTPWAVIDSDSEANIKSRQLEDILFKNYPSTFVQNGTFNNIAVIRPKSMTEDDFATMTNIFNLIGNYAQSNVGKIKFYSKKPAADVLKNSSVIVFGTPSENNMVKDLNSKLYFKFDSKFDHFVSNEKLSIESQYGHNVGTAQLLRSPYNEQRGLLVVTAAQPADAYLASTQINFQKNIQQYQNVDAILVDQDNNHYSYRFKKNAGPDQESTVKQSISKNSKLLIFVGLALFILIVLGTVVFMLLKKNNLLKYGRVKNESR